MTGVQTCALPICHTLCFCVFVHVAHLLVEVVLYVAYVVYFRGVCGHNLVEHGLRVACVVAPAEEVGSAVLVAESAESCVGEQPVAVALHKSLEVGAVECRFAVLNENLACVFVFGFVHALVVYFLESVYLRIVLVQLFLHHQHLPINDALHLETCH